MTSRPLPPNTNPSFIEDYAAALVYPAHPDNYYKPKDHNGVPNRPRGWVLHTPEEDADDVEVTPAYFRNRLFDKNGNQIFASTHYYLDSDGDVIQMVPESHGAIANGLKGKPLPKWADPSTSLNWQTVNVEIEGRGHIIHDTMPVGGPQFLALVALIKDRAQAWGIPLDREHIIGHYEVANDRSDPGARFPWDALIAELQSAPIEPPKERRHMKDWAIVGLENELPDAYLLKGNDLYLIPGAVEVEDLRKLIYEDEIIELHAVTWEFLDSIGVRRQA